MGPLVYVVILNWNGRERLRDCLTSVLAQIYEPMKVLVVDNGSTDGSREMVRETFPEAGLIGLPENLHFARGMNEGMREAMRDPACEFLVLLNNDVRADPECVAHLVSAARSSGTGAVASKMLFMDRPGVINSTGLCPARDGSGMDRGWNEPDEGQYDADLDVFGASAGAGLYRRKALEQVGLFDGDFVAYGEDLDLAWRLRLGGWEARFAPRAVVHHKYSASTAPRSDFKAYCGERNRIWTLVQNYPWVHVLSGIGWNGLRMLASRVTKGSRSFPAETGPRGRRLDTLVRARLDAYAGLPRALAKRRARKIHWRANASMVEGWLRRYGVPLRKMLEA